MRVAVGTLLRARPGSWQHTAPTGYAYQWQRCADGYGTQDKWSDIGGAASAEYRITEADKLKTVRCKVTATNPFGSGVNYTPAYIVSDERTPLAQFKTFGYGPYGGTSGKEAVTAAYPAAVAGSPCVLMLHEGGFTEQNPSEEPAPGEGTNPGDSTFVDTMEIDGPSRNMNSDGFAVFNANWRQDSATVKPGFTFEMYDIQAAIAWIKANAEMFNGDPSELYVIGGSSGSSLAMMIATKLNEFKPGYVKAVGALSGIASLAGRVRTAAASIAASRAHIYGTLSAPLSTASAITSLAVNALTLAILSGEQVQLEDPASGNTQNFKTTAEAKAGATTVAVTSQKPNFAYPATTTKLHETPDIDQVHHINHVSYFSGISDTLLEIPGWIDEPANDHALAHLNSISPITHVGPNMPPILYMISKSDKVPVSQAEEFIAAATAAGQGSKVTFREPESGHGYSFWGSKGPLFPTYAHVSDEYEAFLRAHP